MNFRYTVEHARKQDGQLPSLEGRKERPKGRRREGGRAHGRNAEELNLRQLESEEEGDSVVVTGITIEPDGDRRRHGGVVGRGREGKREKREGDGCQEETDFIWLNGPAQPMRRVTQFFFYFYSMRQKEVRKRRFSRLTEVLQIWAKGPRKRS